MGRVGVWQALGALGEVAGATSGDDLAEAVLTATLSVVGADSAVVTRGGQPATRVRSWPSDFLSIERVEAFEALNGDEPWPLATHTRSGAGFSAAELGLLQPTAVWALGHL